MTSDQAAAMGGDTAGPAFDTSIAHQARVYDYLLGGKDNYAVDRRAAEAFGPSSMWCAVGRKR